MAFFGGFCKMWEGLHITTNPLPLPSQSFRESRFSNPQSGSLTIQDFFYKLGGNHKLRRQLFDSQSISFDDVVYGIPRI